MNPLPEVVTVLLICQLYVSRRSADSYSISVDGVVLIISFIVTF